MKADNDLYLLVEFEIPVRGVSKFNQTGHLDQAIRNRKELKYFSDPEKYLIRNNFIHESASDSCIPGLLVFDRWKIIFIPVIDSLEEKKRTDFLKCLSNYNPCIYKTFSGGLPAQIPFAKIDCLLSVDRHGHVTKFNPDIKKWVVTSDGSDVKQFASGLKNSGDTVVPNTSHRIIVFSTDFNSYSFRVCQDADKNLPGLDKRKIQNFMTNLTLWMSNVIKKRCIDLALESQERHLNEIEITLVSPNEIENNSFKLFSAFTSKDHVDSELIINSKPVSLVERLQKTWFKDYLSIVNHINVIRNHKFEICSTYAYEVCGMLLTKYHSTEIKMQQERQNFAGDRFPVIVGRMKKIKPTTGCVYLFRCGHIKEIFEKTLSQKFQHVERIVLVTFKETHEKNNLFTSEENVDKSFERDSLYENAESDSIILKREFYGPSPRALETSLSQLGSLIKLPQVKTSGKLHDKVEDDAKDVETNHRNSVISIGNCDLSQEPGNMPNDDYNLNVRRPVSPSTMSLYTPGKKVSREKTISQYFNRLSSNGFLKGKTLDQLAGERTTHRSDWLVMYGETSWLNYVSLAMKQTESLCQIIQEENEYLLEASQRVPTPQIYPRFNSKNPKHTMTTGSTSRSRNEENQILDSIMILAGPGTGRTWQCILASLVKICTDSECRKLSGFEDLIEREWVRAGYAFTSEVDQPRKNQRADVNMDFDNCASFVLFLDCVHQLTLQYPTEFEFTQDYLVILLDSALSKGGGLPPFSVEFSSSCEASRICPDQRTCEEIYKTGSLSYFNQWEDKLTYEGLRLIPNWLYWWKYSLDPLKPRKKNEIPTQVTGEFAENFLKPCYEPLAILQPWMHAFFRWTRTARIINGGYANVSRSVRKNLLPKFQSSVENSQWRYMTSSSPYSGWFSDEAIKNCIEGFDGPSSDHFLKSFSNKIYTKSIREKIRKWTDLMHENSCN